MKIPNPYLLFIGDATDPLLAKTSNGIARWRPEWCVGQYRYPGVPVDLGLPDFSLEEGREKGAETLVLGIANSGGVISPEWMKDILRALELGYHVASGLHDRLNSFPELVEAARKNGRNLYDVRHTEVHYPVGNGAPRSGKRLLTVGTDCSVGKMFTTLSIEREMKRRGVSCEFVATGQTGILISERGIAIDAVVSDFISGAVEYMSPSHPNPDHWYLIEGQGSLFHPSYAGVSTGLLHGAQADALVICHEPGRVHMRGLPNYPIVGMAECIRQNETVARLTSSEVRTIGFSLNTGKYSEQEAKDLLKRHEDEFGLPATDPFRFGAEKLVDALS